MLYCLPRPLCEDSGGCGVWLVCLVVGFGGVEVNVVEVEEDAGALGKCDHISVGGGAACEVVHVAAYGGGCVLRS